MPVIGASPGSSVEVRVAHAAWPAERLVPALAPNPGRQQRLNPRPGGDPRRRLVDSDIVATAALRVPGGLVVLPSRAVVTLRQRSRTAPRRVPAVTAQAATLVSGEP